jgi:TPR repeat protein
MAVGLGYTGLKLGGFGKPVTLQGPASLKASPATAPVASPADKHAPLQGRCDAGDMDACNDLGAAYDNGTAAEKASGKGVALFLKACQGGQMMACANAGLLHEFGRGLAAPDIPKAVALYRTSCEGGYQPGCGMYGVMLDNGAGVAVDKAKAIALYRGACAVDVAAACSHLGSKYEHGDGVPQDMKEAIRWFDRSCELGWATGCKYAEEARNPSPRP